MMTVLMNKLWPYVAGAFTILVILAEVFRRGGAQQKDKDALESFERDKEGRRAIYHEQAETYGLSSGDLVERMRRRDGDWGGV